MKYQEMTQEQKAKRNRSNAPSIARYNAANYGKLTIRIRKDGGDGFTLDRLKTAAAREGLSVNGFCVYCLRDKI